MTVYSSQIALALRLIKAKGQKITLEQTVTADAPDPVTDLPAETGAKQSSAYALVMAPNTMTEQAYADQFRLGSMIRSRTRVLTIAAEGVSFVPQEGDKALFDGKTWVFVGVKATAPDGTPIIYEGTVKR